MGQRTYLLGELTRSEILQRNEKVKAVFGMCVNVGTALAIAGAGRWFCTAVDLYTIFWLCIGPIVAWTGLHALTLLEAGD